MKQLVLAVVVILVSPGVSAGEGSMLAFTAGQFGVTNAHHGQPSAFGMAYRAAPVTRWRVHPGVGAHWANDGSAYVYVDLQRDFTLGRSWVFSASTGPGLFKAGDELDLGHRVEFRTAVTLAYRAESGYRVGLSIVHLSNARLSTHNPGTDALMLYFTLPL